MSLATPELERLLRELAPQVLGTLIRRYGDFETCEDAVQEALLAAAQQWPAEGPPGNPRGWLITVATRRRLELWRSEVARRRREQTAARLAPPEPDPAPAADDTLTLLFLCCHPALTPAAQVPLTLRAVGGLRTAEIARALLLPEPTVAQRISRAKQRIRASGGQSAEAGGSRSAQADDGQSAESGSRQSDQAGGPGRELFRMPPPAELPQRLAAVRQVLYLIFNEGYTASSGASLHRAELTAEAIRLTRQLHARLPDDGEVSGLLALMLLTDARRPARARPDGTLIPLAEQDRSRWDAAAIAEGTALIARTLATAPVGPYQLQAAIAAVHDEAARAEDTDWRQILALYELLRTLSPGPMVTLGWVVAVAMVHGPQAGLDRLAAAAAEPALAGHHRVDAVRAHLLDLTGDHRTAAEQYRLAARRTLSLPERRYLTSRANQLTDPPSG